MKFLTESGSIYEIDGDHIRRVNESYGKRADGEWIRMIHPPYVREGGPVVLHLESLSGYGADDCGNEGSVEPITTRITSPVERVWGNDLGN